MKREITDRGNRFKYKSCERKTRYRTIFDSRKEAKRLNMKAYPCRFCGGFHLASKR